MLARSDDEFALFQDMDRTREAEELQDWRDAGNEGPPPPRLMGVPVREDLHLGRELILFVWSFLFVCVVCACAWYWRIAGR